MVDHTIDELLDAALAHVPFDGWSAETLAAAASDIAMSTTDVQRICPKGATDLAVAYHERGDQMMLGKMRAADLGSMRYSEKVAAGVRFRLEAVADKEIVRRGLAFFSLPTNGPLGAKLIWNTADKIWTELGDTSDDINWYSKRAILSGVYGATLLFWLGDTSDQHSETWKFLNRRIEDVMKFEKVKAQVRENPIFGKLTALPNAVLKNIKAPSTERRSDLPGRWNDSTHEGSQRSGNT